VRPGVIDVYEGNRVSERIFVSGGFAEVTPERCTVLADEAMPLSSLDRAQIEESLKAAEAEIASLRERLSRLQGPERDQAIIELAAAEARRATAQAKREALAAA
jgi:F-type H+-transporting ATPase subunit epsilon